MLINDFPSRKAFLVAQLISCANFSCDYRKYDIYMLVRPTSMLPTPIKWCENVLTSYYNKLRDIQKLLFASARCYIHVLLRTTTQSMLLLLLLFLLPCFYFCSSCSKAVLFLHFETHSISTRRARRQLMICLLTMVLWLKLLFLFLLDRTFLQPEQRKLRAVV